jgi:hypothetical protein
MLGIGNIKKSFQIPKSQFSVPTLGIQKIQERDSILNKAPPYNGFNLGKNVNTSVA